MDRTTLVGIDIDGGRRLLEALDKAEFDIHAALWLYMPEPDEWRLMLAFPLVDREGPKKAYSLVRLELEKFDPPLELSLMNISVVGLENHIIKALLTADYSHLISKDKWLNRGPINGVYIEGAYIYRLKVTE